MGAIPKISVIIPVFQVEHYLEQCVDSVLCQSMEEIEIILVDDGSPDRCGEMCDKYAKKDSRVRVVHQDNQGLSQARNAGIEIAKGEYIMFVDSDDWVDPDYCRVPYTLARDNHADLVIFRFRVIGDKHSQTICTQKPGIISKENAMNLVYHGGGIAVWNKLYSKKLIQEVRFVPQKYYEDQLFTIEMIHTAEHVYYTDHTLYYYRKREGSITKLHTREIRADQLEMRKCSATRLKELGYEEEARRLYLEFCWNYRMWFGMIGEDADRYNRELLNMSSSPEWLGWKSKLLLRLLRISPWLFDVVCFLFKKRIRDTNKEQN